MEFIGRNWRGEYSLPKTYWLFGVIGVTIAYLVGAFIFGLIGGAVTGRHDAQMINVVMAIYTLFFIPIQVWSLVSIWRSASYYIQAFPSKSFWGYLAKVMVVFGWISVVVGVVKAFSNAMLT